MAMLKAETADTPGSSSSTDEPGEPSPKGGSVEDVSDVIVEVGSSSSKDRTAAKNSSSAENDEEDDEDDAELHQHQPDIAALVLQGQTELQLAAANDEPATRQIVATLPGEVSQKRRSHIRARLSHATKRRHVHAFVNSRSGEAKTGLRVIKEVRLLLGDPAVPLQGAVEGDDTEAADGGGIDVVVADDVEEDSGSTTSSRPDVKGTVVVADAATDYGSTKKKDVDPPKSPNTQRRQNSTKAAAAFGFVCDLGEENVALFVMNRVNDGDVLLVCGGDGTQNLVMSILQDLGPRAPRDVVLVPVPLGTGNDCARALGWGSRVSSMADLADRVLAAQSDALPRPLDVWEVIIVPHVRGRDVANSWCGPRALKRSRSTLTRIQTRGTRKRRYLLRLMRQHGMLTDDFAAWNANNDYSEDGDSHHAEQHQGDREADEQSAVGFRDLMDASTTSASEVDTAVDSTKKSSTPRTPEGTKTVSKRAMNLMSETPIFHAYWVNYFQMGMAGEIVHRVTNKRETRCGRCCFARGYGHCIFSWAGIEFFCCSCEPFMADALDFAEVEAATNGVTHSDARASDEPPVDRTRDTEHHSGTRGGDERTSLFTEDSPGRKSEDLMNLLRKRKARQLTLLNIPSMMAGKAKFAQEWTGKQKSDDGNFEIFTMQRFCSLASTGAGCSELRMEKQAAALKLSSSVGQYMDIDGEGFALKDGFDMLICKSDRYPLTVGIREHANNPHHRAYWEKPGV
ncbi:unnamed protein product [Amoebophrya sp. A25]|nr:unnamed protein product [Amoebophrya sp. A25]|eukprot:GSA25T00005657001.1